MALIAALSMALMAGAACARNSEDEMTTGAVGTAQGDSAMGHRDTTRMQTGRADTSWSGQRDTTTMRRDTTMMPRDTASTMNNPSGSTSTSSNAPDNSGWSSGSTTTSPNSSSSPTGTGSTTTTTPQASGPSAAGYSYEPSVAAPRAATGQQQLTDATILAVLDRADMADSASGAVAMKKGASPQVKDFGRMMTRDHHQSHTQVMKLAKSLNVTLAPPKDHPISVAATRDSTTLASTPAGEQFDRTYIDQQVAMHEQVIEFAKQAEQSTKNEQIKRHIEESSPVLQRHLQRAQELQQSLGRMPT
jgi:putative membrane protein